MSNNIYDILKKIENLEAPRQNLTEGKKAKPDYIDIDKDGDKKEPMKKAAKDKAKGGMAEAVARVEQQLSEKYMGFKKLGEDISDIFRSPEGIAKNRADQARADQNFADRSAKHFAGEIGDQYHDQLMKNSPSYADEYRSRAKDMPYDKLDKLARSLQAKHDPMGGPTNIDYEKIKKNPMSTRAGEQGSDWRPWGPGPKDSFDTDKFGRPVREGEAESGMKRQVIPVGVIDGPGGYEEAQERIKKHEASKVKRQELPAKELPPIEDRSRRSGDESGRPVKEEEMSIEELQRLIDARKEQEFKQFTGEIPDDPESDDTYPDITIKPEVQESGLQAYLGKKKYGKEGMQALQKAGRDGASKEKMAKIRARHDKMDEDAYNEDMLSPKQKKIARMAGDPKKIDAKDFAALRGQKKGKKDEGNAFSGALDAARDAGKGEFKVGGKEYKVKEGEAYDKAWAQTRAERKDWEKSNPDKKYYDQGPAERHDMELRKARAADDAAKDAKRSPLGRVANTLSRGLFGQDIDEGRTSMREGWEEMQKYLEKKRGPESKGGAGKKSGTRYGGSAQKDDDEETDGEGQAVVKKKGRPKGTGGGAKFNFKKPKD
jgi:hypothetical protein